MNQVYCAACKQRFIGQMNDDGTCPLCRARPPAQVGPVENPLRPPRPLKAPPPAIVEAWRRATDEDILRAVYVNPLEYGPATLETIRRIARERGLDSISEGDRHRLSVL